MVATATAIALGGVVAIASPSFAAAKTPLGNATGNVVCQITAKVKINPPLSNSAIAPNTQPSTTTAKVKSTSCSSSGGTVAAHMTGGKLKGTVTSTGTEPGTCTGLLTPGTTPFTAVSSWKPVGATMNPTTITFANVQGDLNGFDLPAGGVANKANPVVSGSFANNDAWARANTGPIDSSVCFDQNGKKAKGLKKLNVSSGSLNITLP
jgi:hypothetical protein